MTRSTSNAARASVLSAAAAAIVAAGVSGASAQQQPQMPPQGWVKTCNKEQDVDICYVQNVTVADGGQLLIALSLLELKGKVNRRAFQIIVPTNRLIPPGIGLQIDGGQTRKVDYTICFPDRCVGEIPVTDDLIASFKRGQALTMTSINFQNQPNPMQVSLAGFTAAYDGPALQQGEADEKRRQLQEFVDKNNEEFQRKLKEEQEKAKAGN